MAEGVDKMFDELEKEVTAKPTSTITPPNKKTKEDNRYNEKYYHIINLIRSQYPDLQFTEDKNKCPTFIHPVTKKVVVKILPRLNCWYGVWRRIDTNPKSKFKAFRIHNEAEEAEFIDHLREIVTSLNNLASEQTFEDVVKKKTKEAKE